MSYENPEGTSEQMDKNRALEEGCFSPSSDAPCAAPRFSSFPPRFVRPGPPPLEETPRARPVTIPVPETDLMKNLEKYRQMALEIGVDEAVIVPTGEIPQDIRVYYKCVFPRCYWFGTNAMCPPHWKTPWEEAKMIVQSFRYAIVTRTKVDPSVYTGPNIWRASTGKFRKIFVTDGIADEELKVATSNASRASARASLAIEREAFYDGYPFSFCLGGGPCLLAFCEEFGVCHALKGGPCKFPTKARPEGAPSLYLDFNKLSQRLGWKTTRAGYLVYPEDVPTDLGCQTMGMVFID